MKRTHDKTLKTKPTTSHRSFKNRVGIILGILLMLFVAGWLYLRYDYLILGKEVDDNTLHAPIQAEIVQVTGEIPVLKELTLAAGIAYNPDKDVFFISTDQPHSLIPNSRSEVFVVNASFTEILASMTLETDEDLEGSAYLGQNRFASISEAGIVYFFEYDTTLTEIKRKNIFSDHRKHKLGSLAYDHDTRHLYTAEKEGEKIVYKLDEEGNLIEQFALQVADSVKALREYSLETDYTVAGMAYTQNMLYVFSEAYSTVMAMNLETKLVEQVYGVEGMRESAGIAIKGNRMYAIGDLENYIPDQAFYIFAIE